MIDVHDLADIVRDLGAREVKVRNGKVTCSCLLARWTHFSRSDSKPSMVVYPAGRYGDPIFKCMGCHEEGSLRDLVLTLGSLWCDPGLDYPRLISIIDGDEAGPEKKKSQRAYELLDAAPRVRVPIETTVQRRFEDGKPFYDHRSIAEADAVEEIPAEVYEPYSKSLPRYALNRGLTLQTCREWKLGNDKEGHRLLFPIWNRRNQLVAISGRLYAENCIYCEGEMIRGKRDADDKKIPDYCARCGRREGPKYLHNDGFKRNFVLYGEHRKDDNVDGNVYVVEGHLDMLMLWQAGYRPVVAMLGSYPGRCQIEKLIAHWGRQITVVSDGDKAGDDMVVKIKQLVADRVPVIRKKLPEKTDPASLIRDHQLGKVTTEQLHEILGKPPIDLTQLIR